MCARENVLQKEKDHPKGLNPKDGLFHHFTDTVIANTFRHTTKDVRCSDVCVMVEMAVIETASENTFPQISTSVAVHFRFPLRNATRQAFRFGSPVLCDGLQGSVPVHIYR